MYKCNIRIAAEGGEPPYNRDIPRRVGENIERSRERLKVCPNCRVVWEAVVSTGHVPAFTEYYDSWFPRYGKPIETCPKCRMI